MMTLSAAREQFDEILERLALKECVELLYHVSPMSSSCEVYAVGIIGDRRIVDADPDEVLPIVTQAESSADFWHFLERRGLVHEISAPT